MNKSRWSRAAISRHRSRKLSWLMLAVSLLLDACGGGSPQSQAQDPASTPPAAIAGSGAVLVTVTDAFGAPADGADVTVYTTTDNRGPLQSDASGQVTVDSVNAGPISVEAWLHKANGLTYAGHADGSLQANGRLDIAISMKPTADEPAVVIGRTAVQANGIQADGRFLEFSVQVFLIPRVAWESTLGSVTLEHCTPVADNDVADCIDDPGGFDSEYLVASSGQPLEAFGVDGVDGLPYSAALLLDQSRRVAANDPLGARWEAAKYFLALASSTGRAASVILAAFAADDESSGELSPLPQQPVTIYPVENPAFGSANDALVQTMALQDGLEGGATPLLESIDRMLEFTAAKAPTNERRSVVVLSDGRDDICGTPARCKSLRDAVIQKSRASGVEIDTIGFMNEGGDNAALRDLAESSGGAALWIHDPSQVGLVFGALAGILDGTAQAHTFRFRLESPMVGAFRSGGTVLGMLRYEICPWDCRGMTVPIAVRIP